MPLVVGALLLTARVRPPVLSPPNRLLDLALLAWFACAALQLVPLPPAIRLAVSPHAVAVDQQLRLDAAADPLRMAPRPLSIDPASTVWALAAAGVMLLAFWCARRVLARRSPRALLRSIAAMGLAAGAVAILQHATSPRLLYWVWRPVATDAQPFSPFVNRNDLATWLVMALPLVIGYVVARFRAFGSDAAGAPDVESALDDTGLWLAGSVCLMTGALLATTSRSGFIGGAVGLAAFVWLSRGRMAGRGRAWLAAAIVTVVAVGATYANVGVLADRFGDAVTRGLGGRREIWRETWPMVADFWRTGVGAGAYERGMLVYQSSPRRYFYFNHAHNEYLQLLAEGGVLLAVPGLVALVALTSTVAGRLRRDRSSFYWIRAGATGGLVGAAVQSLWETGLRLPANGVLFALLAAIAVADTSDVLTGRSSAPPGRATDDAAGVRDRGQGGGPPPVG